MRTAAKCMAVVCLSGFTVASAATTPITPSDFLPGASVIGFETGSTGLPTVPGVTFLRESPDPQWFSATGAFIDAFFEEQVMTNLVSSTFSDVAIEFATPVQAVGAWVGKVENFLSEYPDVLDVRVLDSLGNELAATTVDLPFPERGDNPLFVGYRSDAGIARIEWLGGDSGFFGADNVTYGDAVPEPTTGLLLVAGAAAWFCRRRRPATS